MPYYRVAWLLPISQPPIRDAWLRTDRGRVVAFGHSRPGDFTAAQGVEPAVDCAEEAPPAAQASRIDVRPQRQLGEAELRRVGRGLFC